MLQKHEIFIDSPFRFEAGGEIPSLTLVYHTSPREYKPGEKVVWICHALTGNSNPEDWWPTMVGPGMLFDPEKVYVVCSSILCSPYGLCGPASVNPLTGKQYLKDFPRTTVRDLVTANILVRKHLGIEKIDLMIGPSIGGYQAYEWVVMEPDVIEQAVFLATSFRCAPYITAFNESQRMAILSDPSFEQSADIHGGEKGMKCARSIALISYRSAEGYNLSQEEQDEDTLFADRAASYQRYQGEKLVRRDFDAYSYWHLTYQLDSMNVGRGRGGVAKALGSVKAVCTVITITSDSLFPPSHGKAAVSMIPKASYHEIFSLFGHDGFLLENDSLGAVLRPLMSGW